MLSGLSRVLGLGLAILAVAGPASACINTFTSIFMDHKRAGDTAAMAAELEEMPVLVTRADVLDHLARLSSNLAQGLAMGRTIRDVARAVQDPRISRLAEIWSAKLPAVDLQIAAAQEAAIYLRQIAAEDRILAARNAANSAKAEPTRG